MHVQEYQHVAEWYELVTRLESLEPRDTLVNIWSVEPSVGSIMLFRQRLSLNDARQKYGRKSVTRANPGK